MHTAQKLREIIDKHGSTLGQTPNGRDWCIKALHPSDPVATCSGVPDHANSATVVLNYQSTFTLSPSVGATGSWGFDSLLMPDPVSMMWYSKTDSIGTTAGNFLNTQLPGTTYADKFAGFRTTNQVSRWRLAYMSVSAYQDGPALSDQGTVAAAQYMVEPQMTAVSTSLGALPATTIYTSRPIMRIAANHLPDYTTLQAMPNAYFGQSKYGAYMPLRLNGDLDDAWLGERNICQWGQSLGSLGNAYTIVASAAAPAAQAPYNAVTGFWVNSGSGAAEGGLLATPGNPTWGALCVRNLSVNTGFTFFVRAGWELEVLPTSPIASLMRISPTYDPQALEAYFAISRELKDAYPVEYNDLGKLWDTIKGVIKQLAPGLGMLGPVGAAVGAGVGPVVDFIDSLRKKPAHQKPSTQVGDKPPAAALERAQDAVKAGVAKRRTGTAKGAKAAKARRAVRKQSK